MPGLVTDPAPRFVSRTGDLGYTGCPVSGSTIIPLGEERYRYNTKEHATLACTANKAQGLRKHIQAPPDGRNGTPWRDWSNR